MDTRPTRALAVAAALAFGAAAWAADRAPDAWLTTKVKAELAARKNVSALRTEVDTKDGIVTLRGTAGSQAEKELAGEYAAGVDGVRHVNNELVVRTGGGRAAPRKGWGDEALAAVDDAAVTSRVKTALAADKGTSALKTRVTTKDGVVTLRGTARTSAEKTLAGERAKDVSGVKSVDNRIVVPSR